MGRSSQQHRQTVGDSPVTASAPGRFILGLPGESLRPCISIAVARIAVVMVAAGIGILLTGCATDSDRWSAFPHAMGCAFDTAVDTSDPQITYTQPPDAARVTQVSLDHPGGQQLALSIQFAQPPEPATFLYAIFIRGAVKDKANIQILSPTPGPDNVGWVAGREDRVSDDISKDAEGKPGPRHNDPNVLTSVEQNGNVLRFVVDLAGQSEVLGQGPFKPTIRANMLSWDPAPPPGSSAGAEFFYGQECRWDTSVAEDAAGGSEVSPASPVPAQTPQPQPASPAPPPAPIAQQVLPDAENHGFISYPDAHCLDIDSAAAIGRTSDSLVVICQTSSGQLYYRGFGLQNNLAVFINNVVSTGTGFTAFNNGYSYAVSRDALVISQGSAVVSDKAMVEYWPG